MLQNVWTSSLDIYLGPPIRDFVKEVKIKLRYDIYYYIKKELEEERLEKSILMPSAQTPSISGRIQTIVYMEIIAEQRGRHPYWNPDPERNMMIRKWCSEHPTATFEEYVEGAFIPAMDVKSKLGRPDLESMK